MTEPTPPTNYKDPVKKKNYVDEKRDELAKMACYYPVTGTVTQAVLLNQDGASVFSASDNAPQGKVSYDTFHFLAHHFENHMPSPVWRAMDDPGFYLYGLRIKDRLRLMALDAANYVARTPDAAPVPSGLWYNKPFEPTYWCDPYDALVPSERRGDVPYDALLDFLNLGLSPGLDIEQDPVAQANKAAGLVTVAGL